MASTCRAGQDLYQTPRGQVLYQTSLYQTSLYQTSQGQTSRDVLTHCVVITASPAQQSLESSHDVGCSVFDRAGYDLDAAEVERLLTEVSGSSTGGRLGHVEFAASQIDYRYLQEDHADRWLALART